jgi:hypothetical protein
MIDWLRRILGRPERAREFHEEIQSHLDMRAARIDPVRTLREE